MIIVDYNGVAVSEAMALLAYEKQATISDIKTVILNRIVFFNKKFKGYGDMVICHEGKGNWRKELYQNFKKNRKLARKKSDVDWNFIYEAFNESKEEIKENLQWMNIEVASTEADDSIAVITKMVQEQHMIVSRDSDFCQLHNLGRVDQWDWVTKKKVVAKNTLHEKIVRGSAKENISNIFQEIDFLSESEPGKRQKPITKKLLSSIEEDFDFLSGEQKTRYYMNRQLMDFNYIPAEIQLSIEAEYTLQASRKVPSVMKMQLWLAKNKYRQLARQVEDFVN